MTNFGFIDPGSVERSDDNVIADFYLADSGKRMKLQISIEKADKLLGLLDAQLKGVIYLDPKAPGMNRADRYQGFVRPSNRKEGEVTLRDGTVLEGSFPNGSFEGEENFAFKGVGAIFDGTLHMFEAELLEVPSATPSITLG